MLTPTRDLQESLLGAWRTNNRVMLQLVGALSPDVWHVAVPGEPRRTIQWIAAHVHNSRCGWIRTLGREHGLTAPARVDPKRVTRAQVVAALKRSGAGMEALLKLALASGGELPPSKGYMVARQAGHRLPAPTVNALWWWKMERPRD